MVEEKSDARFEEYGKEEKAKHRMADKVYHCYIHSSVLTDCGCPIRYHSDKCVDVMIDIDLARSKKTRDFLLISSSML